MIGKSKELWIGNSADDIIEYLREYTEQEDVGFHLREGSYFHSRTDWLVYMDAVEKYLSRAKNEVEK